MTSEEDGRTRHTIFSARAKGAFLDNLQLNGNVRLACRAARVSPQTAYRARRRSAQFAALWDAALVTARTRAEEVLADRALNGVEEAVFYHGEEVARRRRYDSRLLLAHLARLDRLADREDVAGTLPALDDTIEALKAGEELVDPCDPHALRQACPEHCRRAQDERGFVDQDPVPCVPDCRDSDTDSEEPLLERRLRAMERARPEGAALPEQMAEGWRDADRVEMAQLAAFEAGEDEWWLKR